MDWWRVLRNLLFGLCLVIGIFAPETWIASSAIRGLLAYLGAGGLSVEEQMLRDEQRFQQKKSLSDMDERSRQSQHERDMQILRELEDFWSNALAPGEV
jgi:hypothetical protein